MISKKNLIFLGMMGAGKSSIGYLVSKKLDLDFIDIDNLIENKVGMCVSDIFTKFGEKHFRNLEEKITLKILKKNNNVVSLGGGSFINDKIRKEILINHTSFWLNWSDEILLKRIKGSIKRPVALKLTDIEIKDLIKKRSKIYAKARYKINCDELTKIEIVKKVIKIYETN